MKQCLIVIDAQEDLINGSDMEPGVFEKERLITNINLVVNKAMEQEVPVIFVRDLDIAGGEGTGFQVHKDIHIPADAAFFNKSATNAFYETGLLEHLKHAKVKHLVVMGCATQFCIDTAVRTATVSGFDVTLVGDGHSTSDNEILQASEIIKHHNKTLHGHYNVDHFSIVRITSEDLFQPTHDTYRNES